ncbi:ferredoxin [Candidatus Saganbacteria bacterium CG08_land_8_20_14_0_20_45_16]|uniref:Ferredoxin n=1 Tax=Candidatus Saganbacteria bacterium CG08_land_8_20_14_0_20_45_16 TaxID=2014293 RepID=A0A2H0XXY3_UNCSA|nr:MAG: ferredoxin [Candidatus Saganbacteria bacterium CG08_land_8_20_14_0_20_45_16]
MINKEKDFKIKVVEQIAKEMSVAARTAPKAKGLDLLDIVVIAGEEIEKLSAEMLRIGQAQEHPTFLRDGQNILAAQVVLLIGTKTRTIGLRYCGFCGYENCAAAEKAGALCAYNPGDLGIAIGSAVSVAADHRLDSRVMYTAGKAALSLNLLVKDVKVAYGIPLSATGKNPFFDR